MKTSLFFVVFVLAFSLFSCEKEVELETIDCEYFAQALIYMRSDSIKNSIDKLTFDLNPEIKDDDNWGHKKNIDLLIERLNAQCKNITASLGCYACIETLPPQSEIIISTDSCGIEIRRVIDILTPDNGILKYINVHGYQ